MKDEAGIAEERVKAHFPSAVAVDLCGYWHINSHGGFIGGGGCVGFAWIDAASRLPASPVGATISCSSCGRTVSKGGLIREGNGCNVGKSDGYHCLGKFVSVGATSDGAGEGAEPRRKMDLTATMEDYYPSDETERLIREFSGDVRDLLEAIREIWHHGSWGWAEEDGTNICDRPVRRYNISTGGWSGNESLIEALRENLMFWMLFWVQERVGGHFIFEVGEGNTSVLQIRRPVPVAPPVTTMGKWEGLRMHGITDAEIVLKWAELNADDGDIRIMAMLDELIRRRQNELATLSVSEGGK